jgi:DNA (cytosine-5)-methyltransferase 1
MKPLRVLDLFSGIGGFSLGLERTGGFRTVAFCEIEPFPCKVLAKNWPEVPIYEDVRTLTADRLAADGIAVDVICGGFPCQDISTAGLGLGIAGPQSGLWSEFSRLIGEIRPRYVLVENVAAMLSNGMGRVCGDLASQRYDSEWHCIPASAVGSPQGRDRVWIVAHPFSERGRGGVDKGQDAIHADPCGKAGGPGRNGSWWAVEPGVGRLVDGFPGRLDRLKALGNAVVPQIPELIGNAILASIKTEGA